MRAQKNLESDMTHWSLMIFTFFFIVVISYFMRYGYLLIIPIITFNYLFYCIGKIKGQEEPQSLEDGIIYVYDGCDKEEDIVFLKKHVHIETPILNPLAEYSLNNLYPVLFDTEGKILTSTYDYDETGQYEATCFDRHLQIGDLVKKYVNGDKIGIVRAL